MGFHGRRFDSGRATLRALALVVGLVWSGLALAADEVPTEIQQPGTQPGDVANLETPDKCDNCHGNSSKGVELSHDLADHRPSVILDQVRNGVAIRMAVLYLFSGRRPHAVVQLRQEDKRGVLYSLVGFQTKLRIGAQRALFRSLPGLAEGVFARFGSVHRNTYLNAPRHLAPSLELRARPGVYVAGQLAGVEGYVESAALGLLAGVHVAFAARGRPAPRPAPTTAHGALLGFLADADPNRFQPMNVNFGLFPPIEGTLRGKERKQALSARALRDFDRWLAPTPLAAE